MLDNLIIESNYPCIQLSKHPVINKAVELNQNYYIYLWTDKNQDEPHVINTDDLEKNLPIDQGGSTWKEAFVKFK